MNVAREYDERWMQRALELASRGVGLCSPNPTTGAVIVRDDKFVGEGFHTYDGLNHAEILALESAGGRARGATLYVNLEPCSHMGRTGPCIDAIIASGIARVVAAIEDPNPLVAGRGFKKLRAAGIEVEVGPGRKQAHTQHEAFARWITSRLPFVTLKSALTLDGQLALPQSGRRASSTWITSEESRAEVHRMRHASDALLTGIGTALADDPRLTDRSGNPRRRPLLRVILDSRLRLPLKSQIVRSAMNDVAVFTTLRENHVRAKKLLAAGIEIVRVPRRRGHVDLRAVLRELGRREIMSVILEAGSALNGAALSAGIVEKLVLFFAPRISGRPDLPFARIERAPFNALSDMTVQRFGPDLCVTGYLREAYKSARSKT